MPRCIWRGEWYVYHHVRREFLKSIFRAGSRKPSDPDEVRALWTPMIARANAYKNPSAAQKAAARLNAALYDRQSAAYPCQPISVVTGEAARCLDLINRRPANK